MLIYSCFIFVLNLALNRYQAREEIRKTLALTPRAGALSITPDNSLAGFSLIYTVPLIINKDSKLAVFLNPP